MNLENSRAAWGKPYFDETFINELQSSNIDALPLQAGLTHGSYVIDSPRKVIVIATSADEQTIIVRVGVFFQSIIAGCNCADDPTPIESINEYCEIEIKIDKQSGDTTCRIAPESVNYD